ncbi:MAG: hypothetical protein P8Z30_04440 [Acidobacteriota bacterium]
MKRRMTVAAFVVTCLITGAGSSFAGRKHSKEEPARNKAVKEYFVAAMGGGNSVDIAIEDYTTKADMQNLATLYDQGGGKALKKALRKTEKGYFKISGGQTMPLAIIQSTPPGPVRHVNMIGITPAVFSARYSGDYSVRLNDYPYTLIELEVNAQGKGRGVMYEFVDLTFDKQGRIHVHPLSGQGYRAALMGVHLEK